MTMQEFLAMLGAMALIKIVYLIGKIVVYRLFGTYDRHLQIGFSPVLFPLYLKNIRIDIGIVVPLPFLLKTYAIEEGQKHPVGYAWEFYDVAWWKRLLSTFGGTYLMMIAGWLIMILLTLAVEERYYSRDQVLETGIYPGELGRAVGFLPNDKVLRVNGKEYERFADLLSAEAILIDSSYYEVLRGDSIMTITLPEDMLGRFVEKRTEYLQLNEPFEVGEVRPGSFAEEGGLKPDDKIVAIDSISIYSFPQFREILKQKTPWQAFPMTVNRDDSTWVADFVVDEKGLLGFISETLVEPEIFRYRFGEAIVLGTKRAFSVIEVNVKGLGRIFGYDEKPAGRAINGPIGIARLFGSFSWERFWTITGFLMMIAVMVDLLPFPGATGLQLIPLLSEGVFRKRMSLKVFRWIKRVPFILLAILMVVAFVMDLMEILNPS